MKKNTYHYFGDVTLLIDRNYLTSGEKLYRSCIAHPNFLRSRLEVSTNTNFTIVKKAIREYQATGKVKWYEERLQREESSGAYR